MKAEDIVRNAFWDCCYMLVWGRRGIGGGHYFLSSIREVFRDGFGRLSVLFSFRRMLRLLMHGFYTPQAARRHSQLRFGMNVIYSQIIFLTK